MKKSIKKTSGLWLDILSIVLINGGVYLIADPKVKVGVLAIYLGHVILSHRND